MLKILLYLGVIFGAPFIFAADVEEPVYQLLEDGGVEAVDDVLAAAFVIDEPGVFQDAQMVTDRRLRHLEAGGDLPCRHVPVGQELQDPAAGRVGQSLESVVHSNPSLIYI